MVYHVLRDGTVTKDITGRVVKIEEAEALYTLLGSMSKKSLHKKKNRGGGKVAQII